MECKGNLSGCSRATQPPLEGFLRAESIIPDLRKTVMCLPASTVLLRVSQQYILSPYPVCILSDFDFFPFLPFFGEAESS